MGLLEPKSNVDQLLHRRYFSRQQQSESKRASHQSNESVDEKQMQKMLELFLQSAKLKQYGTPRDFKPVQITDDKRSSSVESKRREIIDTRSKSPMANKSRTDEANLT